MNNGKDQGPKTAEPAPPFPGSLSDLRLRAAAFRTAEHRMLDQANGYAGAAQALEELIAAIEAAPAELKSMREVRERHASDVGDDPINDPNMIVPTTD